jgi:DNA polymerase-1
MRVMGKTTPRYDVLLIDTYSVFFRAYHALPPMNTQAGEPTQALYGFSSLLIKLLREKAPREVAFALDLPGGTFRNRAFAEYKGTRSRAPDALVAQLKVLDRLMPAFGFPVFSSPGFEADDVLATLNEELTKRGKRVLIASGDRDLFQLVGPHTDVVFLGQRGKPPALYDEEKVRSRYQLEPQHLPTYVALVGDTSDNIPKVKGIGEVTARALVSRFASIEALLVGIEEVSPPRLRDALRAHAEQLRMGEMLATLRRDAPLAEGSRSRALSREAIARTTALFEELEFKTLVPRLSALAPDESK